MKNFAAHASQFIGLSIVRAGLVPSTLVVSKLLDDKLGTMKSGEKAPYVLLADKADSNVSVSLHPEQAKRLFNKGEDAGLQILFDLSTPASEVLAAVQPQLLAQSAEEAAAVLAADEQINAAPVEGTDIVTVVTDGEPAVASESKKALYIKLHKELAAEGKTRGQIKAEALKLGLSAAGFNTYHQNVKSGKWA